MKPDGKSRSLAEVAGSKKRPEIKRFPSGEGGPGTAGARLKKSNFSPIWERNSSLSKKVALSGLFAILRTGDEDAEERSGAAPGDRNAVTAQ